MKRFIEFFPNSTVGNPNDYHYHFFVESAWHSFVEVSRSEYMDLLKSCRKYSRRHHVDVRSYYYRSFNLFLEL